MSIDTQRLCIVGYNVETVYGFDNFWAAGRGTRFLVLCLLSLVPCPLSLETSTPTPTRLTTLSGQPFLFSTGSDSSQSQKCYLEPMASSNIQPKPASNTRLYDGSEAPVSQCPELRGQSGEQTQKTGQVVCIPKDVQHPYTTGQTRLPHWEIFVAITVRLMCLPSRPGALVQ